MNTDPGTNKNDISLELRKKEVVRKLNKVKGADFTMRNGSKYDDIRMVLENKEARQFYDSLMLSLRGDIKSIGTIEAPGVIQERIKEKLVLYSGFYGLVQRVPISTDGRVIVASGEPESKWGDLSVSLEELQKAINGTEVDDIRLGGFMPVCKSVVDDSYADFILYLEDAMIKSLARGLDYGILKGEGDSTLKFEPIGILKDLPESNKVTSDFTSDSVLSHIGLIDRGDKKDIGEISAVMKRQTYYMNMSKLANGAFPYPNIEGLEVKFSGEVDDNQIILGDFGDYLLAERKGVSITSSDHALFMEDTEVYRVKARYDGKPLNNKAFVQITKTV